MNLAKLHLLQTVKMNNTTLSRIQTDLPKIIANTQPISYKDDVENYLQLINTSAFGDYNKDTSVAMIGKDPIRSTTLLLNQYVFTAYAISHFQDASWDDAIYKTLYDLRRIFLQSMMAPKARTSVREYQSMDYWAYRLCSKETQLYYYLFGKELQDRGFPFADEKRVVSFDPEVVSRILGRNVENKQIFLQDRFLEFQSFLKGFNLAQEYRQVKDERARIAQSIIN